jgi:hypothetical protein
MSSTIAQNTLDTPPHTPPSLRQGTAHLTRDQRRDIRFMHDLHHSDIGLSKIGPYNSLNSRAPRARSGASGSHKFYIYLLGIPEIILFLDFLIYYIFFNLINIIF